MVVLVVVALFKREGNPWGSIVTVGACGPPEDHLGFCYNATAVSPDPLHPRYLPGNRPETFSDLSVPIDHRLPLRLARLVPYLSEALPRTAQIGLSR
jgi:hypothetical protein